MAFAVGMVGDRLAGLEIIDIGRAQQHQDAGAVALQPVDGDLHPGLGLPRAAEQVEHRLFAVDAGRHLLAVAHVAEHRHHVLHLVEGRFVDAQHGIHAADLHRLLAHAGDEGFAPDAVGDQVLDGDDLQAVLAGEDQQLRQPLHRAVVIDDLGEDAGRLQPGQLGEIGARLGVAGAGEDAAIAGDQREDVARLQEVGARAIVVGQRPHRVGALLGGDAGGHADLVVDGDGEGGAHRVEIVGDHRRQVQPVGAVGGHRHADDAAGVADHEGHLFRRRLRRGHDQVALVLAVGVVDDDDELALGDGRDGRFDAVEVRVLVRHVRPLRLQVMRPGMPPRLRDPGRPSRKGRRRAVALVSSML